LSWDFLKKKECFSCKSYNREEWKILLISRLGRIVAISTLQELRNVGQGRQTVR